LRRSLQPSTPSKRFTFALRQQHLRVYLGDEMIREVNTFGREDGEEAFVGVMGCSPKGGGVEARFTGFDMRQGVRE
jgi:regulation of enolase protein 1 (concanavalin A-like superfamily)